MTDCIGKVNANDDRCIGCDCDGIPPQNESPTSNSEIIVHRHRQQHAHPKATSAAALLKTTPETTTNTNANTNTTTATTRASTTTTSFLLSLLTREIERDGGACLVTTLKEYIVADHGLKELLQVKPPSSSPSSLPTPSVCRKSSKKRNHQLNTLLTQSNVGKPKLLAFLESHPDVVCVDRTVIPHWVRLVTTTTPMTKTIRKDGTVTDIARGEVEGELRTKAFRKALYVLRKRKARIDRRRNKSPNSVLLFEPDTEAAAATTAATSTEESSGDDVGVYCHWLLRQCSWEFHFFLRYSGFYMDPTLCGYESPCDVKQVGSKEWEDITLATFEQILCVEKDNITRREDRGDDGGKPEFVSWIHVQNGKAFLKQSSFKERNHYHGSRSADNNNTTNRIDFATIGDDESKHEDWKNHHPNCDRDGMSDDSTASLVRRIDQTLTDIVCRKDGGHQVTLQLLLHRYPCFKELLGGRDLWKLYCDFSDLPNDFSDCDSIDNGSSDESNVNDDSTIHADRTCFFQAIEVFYDGANVILRSKRPKTNNDDCNNDNNSSEEKRMKVDEEGLYSVTNNKWGRAMSNLVIQACHRTNLYDESILAIPAHDDTNEEQLQAEQSKGAELHSKTSAPKLVIDLTASVGGMTLALARSNFFDRVIALEIDEVRSTLCRENLGRYGFHGDEQISDDVSSTPNSGRSIVEIRNQDSVQRIPFLPRRACFVIDPPWGGWDYKEKVRRQQLLKLGDTPLEDVLVMMSHHNAPCVVGLRLPTNFVVRDFLTELVKKEVPSIDFECLTVRKVAVQLFVILYFR